MTFEEYWEKLCRANPGLRNGNALAQMSQNVFKAHIKEAFKADASTPEVNIKSERPGVLGGPRGYME